MKEIIIKKPFGNNGEQNFQIASMNILFNIDHWRGKRAVAKG